MTQALDGTSLDVPKGSAGAHQHLSSWGDHNIGANCSVTYKSFCCLNHSRYYTGRARSSHTT
eukprot:5340773-Amphidinium_carterae.3